MTPISKREKVPIFIFLENLGESAIFKIKSRSVDIIEYQGEKLISMNRYCQFSEADAFLRLQKNIF